ncbi:MAG: 50S ribosomal protein L22 [Chlamydiales bacterium]|nr:50S ribosomal protein L22 [Chlamydiales bacterium]
MKQGLAKTKYVRIAPRKARLAAGLIRGKKVVEAMTQLTFCNLRGGKLLKKTLMSAVANAETQQGATRDNLVVSEVRVDEGPTMKRAKSGCRGRRFPIMKRTSHFTVIVASKEQK